MKRFRVRQVNKQFVVWDYQLNRPVTIPFNTRPEAQHMADKFPAYMESR